MASYFDNPFPEKYTYFRIDKEDVEDTDLLENFKSAFEFIDEGRKKGKVLVHCNAGISRAGTMITAYVMKTKAMKRDEAMEFAQSKRNNPIDPNDGFLKQLLEFEKLLIKENVIKDSK
ncbi:hypothetical protein FSP39_008506 [Pinctada imbricata]|uniref:protein-tyrosine-phosphatase n=1 Tax=Pinctada imbricata TaxID=66713 RepID=A0AA88YB49_PINIB|nr:hypothetical protein FSP39_008506 [Pinctada imbricata]